MHNTWFSSDLHFGHGNILKYCDRPFSSVEEMDEAIVENHNKLVKPNDDYYCLGDVTWYGSQRTAQLLKRMNGKKKLIRGNHDHDKNLIPHFEYVRHYDTIKLDGIRIVLMHFPILSWDGQYHGTIHLHGHTHNTIDNSGTLRFDVGVDSWNMHPVNLDQISELVPKRLKENETGLQRSVSKFTALYRKATKDDNRTEAERTGQSKED